MVGVFSRDVAGGVKIVQRLPVVGDVIAADIAGIVCVAFKGAARDDRDGGATGKGPTNFEVVAAG